MRLSATTFAATVLAALAACSDAGPKERPETREGEIRVEGQTQPMTFHRFRPGEAFALPFETYVPADMTAATADSGQGAVVVIRAAFDGTPVDAAAIHIATLPEDTRQADALATVRALAAGVARGESVRAEPPAWARALHRLEGDRLGFVALGEHADRWFYVLVAYPPEYADGMAPRVDAMLEAWRWRDDGTPLRGE